jgi:hypothetical protein
MRRFVFLDVCDEFVLWSCDCEVVSQPGLELVTAGEARRGVDCSDRRRYNSSDGDQRLVTRCEMYD